MDEDFLRELFASVPGFRIRRMFGGQGIYAGDRILALVVDGELYLQSDAETDAIYEAEGLQSWHYARTGRSLRRPGRSAAMDRASGRSLPARGPDEGRRKAQRRTKTAEIGHRNSEGLNAATVNDGTGSTTHNRPDRVRKPPAACASWLRSSWLFPARGPSRQAPVRYGETGRGTCARNAAVRLRDRSRDSARD